MSSGINYRQRGVKVKPTSTAKIRKLAEDFRVLLGIEAPKVDMLDLLEDTLFQVGLSFHVDDPASPILNPEEDACAFPDRDFLVLSPRVYEGLCNDDPRARFTLAHEVGHMLMHGSNIQGFARPRTGSSPHKAYCDSEWQADTFAAEFLMPASIARGMTEQGIMDAFGVSASAAKIRASVLRER